MNTPEVQKAFTEFDRETSIANSKVGCVLASILMPMGSFTMDFFTYRDHLWGFFQLRLISSFLTFIVLMLLLSSWGQRYYRVLRVAWYWVPMLFIACLIYAAHDANSPYYAGFNLVLMAVGVVLPWTYLEILATSLCVIGIYMGIVVLSGWTDNHVLANNLFFLGCTAAIVVTGSFFHSRLRYREFLLRYELDQNQKSLEESNDKLVDQNDALNRANREIKQAEAQLVQSEKMSSLGRFSAGLMHDILNPLNYSRTGTFTLRKKSRDLPPELRATFEEILTDIEDGLKRVDNIVSDLRTFTHPGGQAAEDTDIADIFNIALRFVSSELKEKNITVESELEKGQLARISRNHLILVLVNLLENSIDALADKKFADGERPTIQITSRSENGRSFIFIRDNGPGIDPQIIPKIFDPFYTTKDVGKGTGLGLSICFGILNGYNGTIAAASEPGEFCELTLDLPANSQAAAQANPKNAEPIRL